MQLLPLLTKNKQQKLEQKQLLLNQLFSEEEQVQLVKSLPKMEDSQGNITKWINIIKRIELCIEEEQMPYSRHGQLIAEDILLLSEETFGANQALVDAFWQIRKDEERSATMQLYPVKKEIIQFIEECITYYENNHHRTSITNQDGDY
ncbi:hypothetical protein AAGS61_09585 [Lysinibacillus sp. KU-BSD001]|uniref:hypothetical protein n=1 Tax=Lysinibacillus sp. KU-BSD001 TaxID=3141328 RepID=UPI0036F05051